MTRAERYRRDKCVDAVMNDSSGKTKIRNWMKRIMEKEGLRVEDQQLMLNDCYLASFKWLDPFSKRILLRAVLYTIQYMRKDDEEYDF